jgi:hypothetical protein
MLKILLTTATLALATVSAVAIAAPAETMSFVHDGETYNYSVEKKANSRVIRGTVGKPGKPFVLYVTDKKVRGTVDGRYVSFARSEVKSFGDDIPIASR